MFGFQENITNAKFCFTDSKRMSIVGYYTDKTVELNLLIKGLELTPWKSQIK